MKSAKKLFVIKKYVMASSASAALKLERHVQPDDVWIDEEWRKGEKDRLVEALGFKSL